MDEGFAAAFYADFAPAQAAAIRRAIDLMKEQGRAIDLMREQGRAAGPAGPAEAGRS
ncbi:MAG: hypothetical protein JOY82_27415 [Streptosporangiaceae bacterium]|nr:hypothetical protein [Streptosporangiaceae bacterium]